MDWDVVGDSFRVTDSPTLSGNYFAGYTYDFEGTGQLIDHFDRPPPIQGPDSEPPEELSWPQVSSNHSRICDALAVMSDF